MIKIVKTQVSLVRLRTSWPYKNLRIYIYLSLKKSLNITLKYAQSKLNMLLKYVLQIKMFRLRYISEKDFYW